MLNNELKLSVDIKFGGYDREEITVHSALVFRKQPLEELLCNDFCVDLCNSAASSAVELKNFVDDCKAALPDFRQHCDFFSSNFMVPFKQVKNSPEWKPEYEELVQVKRVHVCKSCKSKARKGCCPEYSPANRVMIKMVVGWNF